MDLQEELSSRISQFKREINEFEAREKTKPEGLPTASTSASQPSKSIEIVDPKQVENPQLSTSSTSAETIPNVAIESLKSDSTKEALEAILGEIKVQFNEIAAGNYPKPQNSQPVEQTDHFDESMLGATHKVEKPEQFVDAPGCPMTDGPQVGATKEQMQEEMDQLRAMLAAFQQLEQSRAHTTDQTPLVQLKMDRVQLPIFNGDLTQWVAFRDQFLELVHNNQGLSPITKFYQLRNHLKGLALEAINGFKMCASDYEAAWLVLRKRYDKTDQIIDEYIRTFEQLPFLSNANMPALIRMVNKTNQLVRVLPGLGVDVKTWDAWIMFTLKSRLDRTTLRKWMDQVKLRQDAKLSELVEFLEVEAFECMPTEAEKIHAQARNKLDPNKKKRSNAISMTINVEKKCEHCRGTHALYQCNQFRALSVKDRIQIVQNANLCIRCLRSHLDPAACKLGACFTCTKFHNNLLCYQKEKASKLKEGDKAKAITAKATIEHIP